MSEWKELKIGDLASRITSGGTPLTKYTEYYGGNIPWLNTKEIKNCRIYETEKCITELGLNNSSAKFIDSNSVIVAMYGVTAGKIAINKIPLTTNQACCNITLDEEKADYNYVYYLLLSSFARLDSLTSGAAQQNLNVGLISNLEVLVPELTEQNAIAEVLSSLDDKIDLLHRQNKTLEALAQTLFRQWFIEEAKDEWEEVPLKEICTIINGFAFKSGDYKDSGRMIIRTMNFENGFIDTSNVVYIDLEEEQKYSKQQLQKNDFLLVMVGASLGKFSIVTSDILPALQNQNMWNFRSLGNISQHYLNFALRQIIENNMGSASGSAREFFQKGQFYEFLITVPDDEKMAKFEDYAEDFYSKIEKNREQIKTLKNMRDTLLPKLMSGEVRVNG